ncbi:hypothetical protein LCGC14_1121310 [marine sediment metagenome]|uniref:Uncharacterized protein n=1 Tax=marine sediment metagenome TaxID=412755 RepID=A0A0F9M3W1_9ZZZZ
MRDFYQEIIDIIGSGGEACCVFPAADSLYEAADFLTFLTTGRGNLDGLTVTYSEDRRNFDRPTIYSRNQARVPIRWQLNGSNEWGKTPSIAAFSRDDTGSNPMSIGGLFSIESVGVNRAMLSKMGDVGTQEWIANIRTTEKCRFALVDDSAGITIQRESNSVPPLGIPQSFAMVYGAAGGASAADDISLYIAGQVVTSTATNNASYVGMEALAAEVYVGAREQSSVSMEFRDWLSTIFFTHRKLSAVEVFNLNDVYVAMQRAQRSRLLAGIF